jgi:hypothetical protein
MWGIVASLENDLFLEYGLLEEGVFLQRVPEYHLDGNGFLRDFMTPIQDSSKGALTYCNSHHVIAGT